MRQSKEPCKVRLKIVTRHKRVSCTASAMEHYRVETKSPFRLRLRIIEERRVRGTRLFRQSHVDRLNYVSDFLLNRLLLGIELYCAFV